MRLLSFKKNLILECKKWVKDGLINENQAQKICNKYNLDYQNPSNKNTGQIALKVLGYLFISIAIILLISENWEEIPRLLRMTALIVATFSINMFGIYQHQKLPNNAVIIFFLGSLLYGISIILIAQMYHLGEHMPDGVLLWAIGVLPFALLARSNYLMILVMVLSTIWFGLESIEFDNIQFGYLIFIFTSLYGLFNWKQNSIGFTISLLALIFFIFQFSSDIYIYLVTMLIFYAFSILFEHSKNQQIKPYITILKKLIIICTSISLILLTTLSNLSYIGLSFNSIDTRLNVIIFLGLLLLGYSLLHYKKQFIIYILLLTLLVLFVIVVNFNALKILHLEILASFIFFIFSIGLITIGIKKTINYYYFFGIFNILIFAFIRYIDLIGGYIGTSILFAVLSMLLLGSAKYWGKKITHE